MSDIGKIIRVNALPPVNERENNVIYQVAAPGAATYKDYAIDANGDLKTPSYIPLTGTEEGQPLTKNIEVDPSEEGSVGFISKTPDVSEAVIAIQEGNSILAESINNIDNNSSSIHLHHDTGVEISATTPDDQFSAIIDVSGLQGDDYVLPTSDKHYVQKKYVTDNFTSQTTLNNTLTNYYTKPETYSKAEVDSKFSAVYRPKGSVSNFASLPNSGNTEGDVWNILDTGANYVWVLNLNNTGVTGWDKLSETVDLTNYMTLNTEQTALGRKAFAGGSGNSFSNGAIETRGNGSTIFPSIGFHQPGSYAGTISMRNSNQFYFRDTNDTDFAYLSSKGYIKSGSDDNYLLLGGGGHKQVTDFVDRTSGQDITGYKTFFSYLGGDIANNRLWVRSTDGSNPALSFIKGGVDNGQITFDGTGFHTFNTNGTGYFPIKSNGFIKNGYDDNYLLLAGGGTKQITDFVLHADLNNYINKSGDTMTGTLNLDAGLKLNAPSISEDWTIYQNAGEIAFNVTGGSYTGDVIKFNQDGTILTNSTGSSYQWNHAYNYGLMSKNNGFVSNIDANDVSDIPFETELYAIELGNGTANTNFPFYDYGTFTRLRSRTFTTDFAHQNNGDLYHRCWYVGSGPDGYSFRKIWDNVNLPDYKNYGLGRADVVSTADLNDVPFTSIQDIWDTTLNSPFGYGSVWTHRKGGAEFTQMAVNVLDGRLYTRGWSNGTGDTGWNRTALYSEVSGKANALENATGIGFSSGQLPSVDGSQYPYFYFDDGTNTSYVALATQGYVSTNYVPYTGATSNIDINSKSLTTTGTIYAGGLNSNVLVSPDLAGGSYIISTNATDLYFGNGNVSDVIYQTLGNHSFQVAGSTKVNINSTGLYVAGNIQLNGLNVATQSWVNSQKGIVNGIASLDSSGLVPTTQLPSYVDDVLEFANLASFPTTGESGKIYVAIDTNLTYRWSGSSYIQIASGAVQSVNGQTGVVNLTTSNISEGSNLYYTNARVKSYGDTQWSLLGHTHSISDVTGLQTALNGKAYALENATAIGFSSGQLPTNTGSEYPYFYYNNGTTQAVIGLATLEYVQTNFATISSLGNYVTTNTVQTISEDKTFDSGSTVAFTGNDQNNVLVHKTSTGTSGALVSGHDYTHYDTRWRVGNVRGSNTNSTSFGFLFSSDNGASYSQRVNIDSTNGRITTSVDGNSGQWNDIYNNGIRTNTGFLVDEDYREIGSSTFDIDDPNVKKFTIIFNDSANGHVVIHNPANAQYFQFLNISATNSIEIEVQGYGVVDSVAPGKTTVYMSWGGGKLSKISENSTVSII